MEVPQNYNEVARCWKEAAKHGNSQAQVLFSKYTWTNKKFMLI
jgi:hypothetical protein